MNSSRETNKCCVNWPFIPNLCSLFLFGSVLKDQVSKDKALQSMASMSSAQIVSASVLQNKLSPPPPLPQAVFSATPKVRDALMCSSLFQEAQTQREELIVGNRTVSAASVMES